MAYAFCIAKAYADEVIARGLPVDEFAGRLSFNFNIFGNLFEQVAKFRAGRGLWAKIMNRRSTTRHGPGSMWLRMIAGGGGGLTFEQPRSHRPRRLLRADLGAVGRADDGAVLLRRGLRSRPVLGAHLAAHDAAPDRRWGTEDGRSARRLVPRRDADEPDAPTEMEGRIVEANCRPHRARKTAQ